MSEKEIILLTTYKDGNPTQENPFSERNAKLKIRAAKSYKNIRKIEKAEKIAEGEFKILDVVWASADAALEVAAVGQLNEQLAAKNAEAEKAKAEMEAMKAELEAAKEAAKNAEAEKAKAQAELKAASKPASKEAK